jgi:hypothetical protein
VVVKCVLGILGCVLAGCAMRPVGSAPKSEHALPDVQSAAVQSAFAPTPVDALPLAVASAPPSSSQLRIGIEYLPPDATQDAEPPRVELPPPTGIAARTPTARVDRRSIGVESRSLLERADIDLAAIDDPWARETLRFVDDIAAADRRRVRREVGLPFFDSWRPEGDSGPLLTSELAMQQDRAFWLQENGMALLRRPVRQLLRRLPLVEQLEVDFAEFRSDHLPLSEPYRQAHGDRRRLGRLSVRLHADDFADPVELVWMYHGVRIGSSQEFGKLSIDWPISEHLQLAVRARTRYDDGEGALRADLTYRASDFTSLHLSVGDDMDFLTTSSVYSLFETPMDGTPGLVLYAVHVF